MSFEQPSNYLRRIYRFIQRAEREIRLQEITLSVGATHGSAFLRSHRFTPRHEQQRIFRTQKKMRKSEPPGGIAFSNEFSPFRKINQ